MPSSPDRAPRRTHLPRLHHRPAPTPQQARRRLFALRRFNPSLGQLVAAVLTALLGVALVAQARVTDEAGLSQLRQTELVALLDDATNRVDALEDEVRQLEADRQQLQGSQGDEAAAEAARQRLESYQILAGTVPVQGPGISVRVDDPGSVVTQTQLLDGIQELRDAGAEAIQIGSVRVVASTYVSTDTQGRVLVDGTPIDHPYSITAIGDPHTLAGSMAIPGGFSDSLRGAGASVTVIETENLQIEALHQPTPDRYARPVPSGHTP